MQGKAAYNRPKVVGTRTLPRTLRKRELRAPGCPLLVRHSFLFLPEALESLKEVSESACPNDGFLDQLKLFEEMGFKVDTSSPLYKRFHLTLLGQSYKFGEKIGSHVFEDDPGLSPQSGSCSDPSNKDERKTAYRCRKCRRIVTVQDNVISHVPGEGKSCFNWNQRKSGCPYNNKEQDCSSLFIEPLKWMTPGRCFGGETILHSLWCTVRVLQLVRDTVQLRQLDYSCLPNCEEH